jgi:hypothetical protein
MTNYITNENISLLNNITHNKIVVNEDGRLEEMTTKQKIFCFFSSNYQKNIQKGVSNAINDITSRDISTLKEEEQQDITRLFFKKLPSLGENLFDRNVINKKTIQVLQKTIKDEYLNESHNEKPQKSWFWQRSNKTKSCRKVFKQFITDQIIDAQTSTKAPSLNNIKFNLAYLSQSKPKTVSNLSRNAGILSATIRALIDLPSDKLSSDELKSISSRLSMCCKTMISKSKKLAHKKEDITPTLEKLNHSSESCKRMQKFIKIGMPIRHLKSQEINNLMFDQHIYEKMTAMGHELQLDKSGNPLFPLKERIAISKKDLLPISEEKIEKDYQQKKASGKPHPLHTYKNGSKKFSFTTYANVSLEEYKTHLMIENIQELFAMNAEKDIKSVTRIIEDGELTTSEGSFLDDFWEEEDFMRQFLQPDGQLRGPDVFIEFPQKHCSIEELKNHGIINQNGSISGDKYQYLGDGFVEHSTFHWKALIPTMTLPPEQRPVDYTLDIISSFKGKSLGGITGHSYAKVTTPEGEVYTFSVSTTKQSLDTHKAVISCPDERFFTPKSVFSEVKGRYIIPDKKTFTQLVQFVEGFQNCNEEDNGETSTSTLLYQSFTENCSTFTQTIKRYAQNTLNAQRVALPENDEIELDSLHLTKERIKSWFIHKGISLGINSALSFDFLKDKSIYGFDLNGIFQGISVEGNDNYGSIEERVKNKELNIFLPRDLAIEILSEKKQIKTARAA